MTHPHMEQCPHCGTANPRIQVEQDALITRAVYTVFMKDGSRFLRTTSPSESMLDNVEYTFACCGKDVEDPDLLNLLEGMCR